MTDLVVVRVEVRLPGSVTDNGEPTLYSESLVMPVSDFRTPYPGKVVPDAIERAARALVFNLRWS